MPHSYTSCLLHCVFNTKERRPQITHDLRDRLHQYLAGISRQNDVTPLAVGGTDDHVHMLMGLPAALPLAKAMQLAKGGSSKWVHETFPGHQDFAWQEGYGAFSVGVSQVEATVAYIAGQAEHHRKRTFREEFVAFLEKHNIEYDARFVWG
jgi:putative transposase